MDLWLSPSQAGVDSEDLLRLVIGERLCRPPSALRLHRSERGKPELLGEEIAFNLSHADGLTLIGVANGGAVGIDLERIRPRRRLDLLMTGALTETERTSSRLAGGEGSAIEWFYRYWTAKEAVAKALGTGLALAPQRIEVEPVNDSRARVRVMTAPDEPLPGGTGPIEVRWLQPAEGYVAAVTEMPAAAGPETGRGTR